MHWFLLGTGFKRLVQTSLCLTFPLNKSLKLEVNCSFYNVLTLVGLGFFAFLLQLKKNKKHKRKICSSLHSICFCSINVSNSPGHLPNPEYHGGFFCLSTTSFIVENKHYWLRATLLKTSKINLVFCFFFLILYFSSALFLPISNKLPVVTKLFFTKAGQSVSWNGISLPKKQDERDFTNSFLKYRLSLRKSKYGVYILIYLGWSHNLYLIGFIRVVQLQSWQEKNGPGEKQKCVCAWKSQKLTAVVWAVLWKLNWLQLTSPGQPVLPVEQVASYTGTLIGQLQGQDLNYFWFLPPAVDDLSFKI